MLDDILERYEEEEFLKADGLDDAIIGVDEASMKLVYSVTKCIEVFMEDGMNYEEAREYFDYNTRRSVPYMGDKAPIFVDDDF